jgi:hypothetical protein
LRAAILRLLDWASRIALRRFWPPVFEPVPEEESYAPDYANIEADAFTLTTEMLNRYRNGEVESRAGVAGILEKESGLCYRCRLLGPRIRPITLALLALKARGIALDRGIIRGPDIPERVALLLGEALGIPVERVARTPDVLVFPACVLALGPVLESLFWPPSAELPEAGTVTFLHEFSDPNLRPDCATAPRFVMAGEDPRHFLFYVRHEGRNPLGIPRARWKAALPNVVFLGDFTFRQRGARRAYLTRLIGLFVQGLRGELSGSLLLIEARQLRRFAAVDYLFDRVRPKVSLHASLPNGNGSFRFDSGIFTALARRYGTCSVGYQTRCTHLINFEELFESYDLWCAWGAAWVATAREYGAIAETAVIGDINLDEIRDGLPAIRAAPAAQSAEHNVVVFLASAVGNDHYTREYHHQLLVATIEAAARAAEQRSETYKVWIKVKDIQDSDYYESHAELQTLAHARNITLTCLRAARFDVMGPIRLADAVISVGFTTPGLDALLIGKPSVYFTVLRHIHPALAGRAFVVCDTESLYRMLRDPQPAPLDVVEDFDPYCDGLSAKRMLAASRAASARFEERNRVF